LRPVDAFTERLPIAPYVGAGVAFSTGDNSDIGPLVTAGVDFPITSRFTATASVNAAFLDETEVGLLVGIGYNFSALGL
jgi:outer membrane protein W